MSDEAPRVDCHECKDLEFARNLAAHMREGYGRHNSNRAFRDAPRGRRAAFTPYYNMPAPYDAAALREATGARVIGRVGNRAIRERWQDCEVGDAVPAANMPYSEHDAPRFLQRLLRLSSTPHGAYGGARSLYSQFTFERVAVGMVASDGVRCIEHFWKRLS